MNEEQDSVNELFKTTKDGRKLFFPWGAFGRGYLVPTGYEYKRLSRVLKPWYRFTWPIIPVMALSIIYDVEDGTGSLWTGILICVLSFSAATLCLIPIYRILYRHLKQTDEKYEDL